MVHQAAAREQQPAAVPALGDRGLAQARGVCLPGQ